MMFDREQWTPASSWRNPDEAEGWPDWPAVQPPGPTADFVELSWTGPDGYPLESEAIVRAPEDEWSEVVPLAGVEMLELAPEDLDDGDDDGWPLTGDGRGFGAEAWSPIAAAERDPALEAWGGYGETELQHFAEDEPELRVEAPATPEISDVVAAFPATLLARGRVQLPIEKMLWELNKGLNAKGPNWVKRIWASWDTLRKDVPYVPVTIELIRLDDLAFTARGAKAYEAGVRLREYVAKLQLDRRAYAWSHTANEAYRFKQPLEQELGLPLDALFEKSGTALPAQMTPEENRKHLLLIYGDFSAAQRYIISDAVVVLDAFAFSKAVLTDVHKQKVEAIVRHLDASWTSGDIEYATVLVVGHTDHRGTEQYNKQLGTERAEAVRDALVDAVNAVRLGSKFTFPTKSSGELQPVIAHPKTAAQHARNRRVEVLLPPPKRRALPQADLPKSLDDVIERGRKLLRQTADKLDRVGISVFQARRLHCVLTKLADSRIDDSYINGYAAWHDGTVRSGASIDIRLFTEHVRQSLVASGFYGPGASDADFLRALGWLDRAIWAGPHILGAEVAQKGAATATGVAQLSEWIGKRQRDPKSIYHCYHPDNW